MNVLFEDADIIVIDKREEALANALRFGATEVYTPDAIPSGYIMDFETMGTEYEYIIDAVNGSILSSSAKPEHAGS